MKYDREFYETNAGVSSSSATAVLSALREVYPATSLLDVGCGIGTWGRASRSLGFVKYRGVDGNYVRRDQLLVTGEEFTPHDLRQRLVLNESYDLAICMEVAEHLPPDAGVALIKSLCAHAGVVMFSAAIPRQGGVDHINEQWQSYWAGLFADEGYDAYDCIRPRIWDREDVAEYYKQNALVYVDRRNEAMRTLFENDWKTRKAILNLVHPATYQIKSDPLRWPLATIVCNFPAIVARVVRNRIFSR